MFRILCDPSSGSTDLCLTEITGSDSQIFCRVLGRCVIYVYIYIYTYILKYKVYYKRSHMFRCFCTIFREL